MSSFSSNCNAELIRLLCLYAKVVNIIEKYMQTFIFLIFFNFCGSHL